jgi:hypothetical protein
MYRYYIKNLRFINYSKFCIVLKIKNCTRFYFAQFIMVLVNTIKRRRSEVSHQKSHTQIGSKK